MLPKMESLLIVEDDDDIRETVADLFHSANFALLTANNGQIGLECILKVQPTAVITDINMPELTGIAMLQKVREAGLEIPIVIITGYSNSANNADAIRYGAFDVVSKPFDLKDLERVVQEAVTLGANQRKFEAFWKAYLSKNRIFSTMPEELLDAKKKMMKLKYFNQIKAA